MGFGQMGQRLIGKIPLDSEVDKRVSFPLYQHSNIPSFHVRGKNTKPQKLSLISISCRISETFKRIMGGLLHLLLTLDLPWALSLS
jgi:hypothetical protein